MSIEQVKDNIFRVSLVGGDPIVLSMFNVVFATYDASTKSSTVYLDNGPSGPTNVVMVGDFRALVAGAGRSGMNAGPLFGIFTDVATKIPVVINFDQVNRFGYDGFIYFGVFGVVASFTYTLLESPADVIGNMGHSIEDIGFFSLTNTTGPTQEFVNVKNIAYQLMDNSVAFLDGIPQTYVENIADLVGA